MTWGAVIVLCLGVSFITASISNLSHESKVSFLVAEHAKSLASIKRANTIEKKAIISKISEKIDKLTEESRSCKK